MLIKTSEISDIDSRYNDIGLMDPRRFLYIFIDEADKNKDPTDPHILAKATQINISTLQGRQSVMEPTMSRDNNISTIITIYNYIVNFPIGVGNSRAIKAGIFHLVNANKMKRESDYNFGHTFPINNSIYTPFITSAQNRAQYDHDGTNKQRIVNEVFNNDLLTSEPIPEPIYYSLDDQYIETGYALDIREEAFNYQVEGYELIDQFCKVQLRSTDEYDTMYQEVNNLLSESQHILSTKEGFLSEMNDAFGLNTIVNGGVMAYDSNKGWNWKGGTIINKQYMINDYASIELNNIVESVIARSKRIEDEFGAIRVFYSPGFIGDRVKIFYKDYNKENQPGKTPTPTKDESLKQDSKFNIESFVDNKVNEWANMESLDNNLID